MQEVELRAEAPDVETSSADYASRFAGRAGQYLLEVQARSVAKALRDLSPGTVLDVGGGHGQLVDPLIRLGWQVTVHGTHPECRRNLHELHGKRDTPFLEGPLFALPLADRSYDLAIAVRLLSHVPEWRRLVAEMSRVARLAVVVDYPSNSGFNYLTPLLFGLKKSMEGNTRSYANFSRSELCKEFLRHGFEFRRQIKQFFLPMVIHRAGNGAAPLQWAEVGFRAFGLTAMTGSPVILRVDRTT